MIINDKVFADDYIQQHEGSILNVTKDQYLEVVKLICEDILNRIISGLPKELPFNLGAFKIIKYKTRVKYINWKETKRLGKYVYYLNLHSDGYSYKFKWDKSKARFYGQNLYKFKLKRVISRSLAKGIKENKLEFLSE